VVLRCSAEACSLSVVVPCLWSYLVCGRTLSVVVPCLWSYVVCGRTLSVVVPEYNDINMLLRRRGAFYDGRSGHVILA